MSRFTQPTAAAAKKTIVKPIKRITPTTKVELPDAEQPNDEDVVHSAYAKINAAFDELWTRIKRPSWVRELVNVTIGLVTYASVIYGCMQLLDIVVMAAIAYTGVGFISFMVTFLGMLAAFMLAFKAGTVAYNMAAAFEFKAVKQRVTGWFNFGKPVAA